MKFISKLILFVFLTSIVSNTAFSQGESYVWKKMKKKNTIKSYKSYLSQYPTGKYKVKAERKQWKLEKKREKTHKKSIKKLHKKNQSKDTLKMMKKAKKVSNNNNRNKSGNFFTRLFRTKK